ncbi:hypothetical protein X747_05420 [Mesorhizobium sp. LNJC384A00]|nr:hypothetical protein X747_05420 [Mesorhizobium sp. LNJC384A00]
MLFGDKIMKSSLLSLLGIFFLQSGAYADIVSVNA